MQVREIDVGTVVGEVSDLPETTTDLVFGGWVFRVLAVRSACPGIDPVCVWVQRLSPVYRLPTEEDFLIRMGLLERPWRP